MHKQVSKSLEDLMDSQDLRKRISEESAFQSWKDIKQEPRQRRCNMEKIIPLSDLHSKTKKFVDQVSKTREPLVITQGGRAAAILVDYETYEGHLATQDEMSFPDWEKRLNRAKQERGKGVSLEAFKKGKRSHARLSK